MSNDLLFNYLYLVYTIGFDCTSYTANEGDRLPLKIIKQGSGTLSVTVSFSPNTSNYSLSSQAVTFAANEMEKNVLVNIINDSYYEGQEIFNITMQSSSNRVQLTQHEAVITIQDQTGTVTACTTRLIMCYVIIFVVSCASGFYPE